MVPGFWLRGESWAECAQAVQSAGHTVHCVDLPGRGPGDDAAGVRLQDQIDAVVNLVDALPGSAVLIGHSGGGPVIYGAADARPGRIARLIYVDTVPLHEGGQINPDLPVRNGVIRLPEWDEFDTGDLRDLTPELKERFRAAAVPEPASAANDHVRLQDERRFGIPATVICCAFSAAEVQAMITEPQHPWHGMTEELARAQEYELIDLPTGHWPQFTKPAELGGLLLRIVEAGERTA